MMSLAVENGRLCYATSPLRGGRGQNHVEGFFERAQFEAVCRRLPADLQSAAHIAFTFGWRTQSEV